MDLNVIYYEILIEIFLFVNIFLFSLFVECLGVEKSFLRVGSYEFII